MEQVDLQYARGPDGTLRVALAGDWKLARGVPPSRGVIEEIERPPLPRRVTFETDVLAGWDSGLLTFLLAVLSRCAQLGVQADRQGLPEGVGRLPALAAAGPATPGRRGAPRPPQRAAGARPRARRRRRHRLVERAWRHARLRR